MNRGRHCGGLVIRGARGIAAAAGLLFAALVPSAGAEQRFVELGAGRGLTASVVNAMLIDRDGLLWVGSREGLFRYDGYEATAVFSRCARCTRPTMARSGWARSAAASSVAIR
jgi:ligand-binding sensor domain-containing protein